MGIFLRITFEARYAGTKEKNEKKSKVVKYITDHIHDYGWQESIVNKLRKTREDHITLSIILRFFNAEDIEKSKLKSYARYMKKQDQLVIDQMLVLNEYTDLSEDNMRKKICDDIFSYLREILEKYKKRFEDFDSIAFIPLLKDRIEEIKDYKLKDDYANK